MTKVFRISGADPGLKGAIAFADVSGDGFANVVVYDMPVSTLIDGRPLPDEVQVSAILAAEKPDMAVIEHVGPRPKTGAASEWRFAMGFSALRSAFRLHFAARGNGPATFLIDPKAWKTPLGLTSDKALSLDLARKIFPSLATALARAKDDGRAEALLLLEFYRREVLPRGAAGVEVC
ncbi:RuvC family protein [Paracoccus yeei]|uniref:DUF429 domain-containing protein n=1 Tax=Paracoccus yeei TaxID=147645 RepID=A0A2D2C231_9RHOB|nr:hypothetical protein [Paracoccus yeei]ATQ56547.1 hypothetical protein PYTT13_12595 [Paracoccus yeei]